MQLDSRPRRRQFAEWHHDDVPCRVPLRTAGDDADLPVRLQDGESTRAYIDTEAAVDALHPRTGFAYAYVRAGGTVYLARDRVDKTIKRDNKQLRG